MLTIDRLRLQLPPDYQRRAASIGRLLATELAKIPLRKNLRLENLRLTQVRIAPGSGDGQIARRIAAEVQRGLEKKKR